MQQRQADHPPASSGKGGRYSHRDCRTHVNLSIGDRQSLRGQIFVVSGLLLLGITDLMNFKMGKGMQRQDGMEEVRDNDREIYYM